ncbi:MAG: hypothetical protein IJK78_12760 [Bacteroidales bacterium]|nr:hypothetical protein [Bacteroidales bacterium]
MARIKQGILGNFRGTVGTVVGASWNGINYMRGRAQSVKNPKTPAQMIQRDFFKEVQELAGQFTNEQLAFLFPNTPKNMTRRNALTQQLTADPIVTDDAKHVDLANLNSIGNAATADLPDVTVAVDGSNLAISWSGASDFRAEHADEYPTIFVANVTKKRIYLVNSTAVVGASGEQSFNVGLSTYGEAEDTFSGFMLATGSKIVLVGFGTMAVTKRPARPKKNA